MGEHNSESNSTPMILGLLFLWIFLVLVLVYLYKRLNSETNNQYTVQQLVFSQGGLRDRVMQGVELVTNFVDRVIPRNHDEEEAIGGDADSDNRENGEREDVKDKDGEGGYHSEGRRDDEDEEEDKDDSSDDYSSVDLKERVMRNNGTGEIKTEENQKDKPNDEGKQEEPKQEVEVKDDERVGLLVNIKPFSGSAIWSEEKMEENNVTAL